MFKTSYTRQLTLLNNIKFQPLQQLRQIFGVKESKSAWLAETR